MSDPEGRATVRIGSFLFDSATGEVHDAGSSGTPATRLPPQPAKLLALLANKNGELATREEIRELLWPDTHVDFDQSLNFCVRQIRSALGDSASEPTYVETLPRRGYRLMRAVEPLPRSLTTALGEGAPSPYSAQTPRSPAPPRTAAPRKRLLWGTAFVALLGAVSFVYWQADRAPAPAPAIRATIRLAIMPFELAAQGGTDGDLARISEWLVAELTTGWPDRLEVIGPRSTAAYSSFPFPDLMRLREDLGVDYVLNARYFERDGRRELIVELIRLDDGKHPFAKFYTEVRPWRPIARDVRDQVTDALALSPS